MGLKLVKHVELPAVIFLTVVAENNPENGPNAVRKDFWAQVLEYRALQ